MQVTSATVHLSSDHQKIEQRSERESLTLWRGNERVRLDREVDAIEVELGRASLQESLRSGSRLPPGLINAAAHHAANRGHPHTPVDDRVELSDVGLQLQPKPKKAQPERFHMSAHHELEVSILREMVRMLTGRELKVMDPAELSVDEEQQENLDQACAAGAELERASQADRGGPEEGWGLAYDHYERRLESESTTFSAEGVIQTADGRSIAFSVDLHMSRTFIEESRTSLRLGDAARVKDPLVINFAGTAAELTRTKFEFDLDADGRSEQVAFVGPNSGFLTWDRNDNGTVDDGGELFGAVTGDGFGELAAHDADGNGWIDEADPIYEALRIWSRDTAGNESLIGLGQRGIGAIYLGHIDTPFDLKNPDNQLAGVIRDSGIWVGEDGQVNTVQKVDLVV